MDSFKRDMMQLSMLTVIGNLQPDYEQVLPYDPVVVFVNMRYLFDSLIRRADDWVSNGNNVFRGGEYGGDVRRNFGAVKFEAWEKFKNLFSAKTGGSKIL